MVQLANRPSEVFVTDPFEVKQMHANAVCGPALVVELLDALRKECETTETAITQVQDYGSSQTYYACSHTTSTSANNTMLKGPAKDIQNDIVCKSMVRLDADARDKMAVTTKPRCASDETRRLGRSQYKGNLQRNNLQFSSEQSLEWTRSTKWTQL